MTETELKEIAKQMGYTVAKKPCYQCSCNMPYPNESCKRKNGKWKCVDKYRPIKCDRKSWPRFKTKCVRVEPQESERGMKCMECKHFERLKDGERGGINGSCKLRNTSSYHATRNGNQKACKTYFEPQESEDGK